MTAGQESPVPENRLARETSPYLLQHARNPVDWFPWGDEAFAKAKAEDKPVLLSVGYSACHWCHVMEHESFENPDIAAVMNRHFVSVKVDREERPDVDQIYMQAVQSMTGHGGWPTGPIPPFAVLLGMGTGVAKLASGVGRGAPLTAAAAACAGLRPRRAAS